MHPVPFTNRSNSLFYDILKNNGFLTDSVNRGSLSAETDILETDQEIKLSIDLPGVAEKDIQLNVKDSMLTLSAEKKQEETKEDGKYRVVERSYGTISRSFRLAENIDVKKITADYKDGVLEVILPKQEVVEDKGHQIEIGSK